MQEEKVEYQEGPNSYVRHLGRDYIVDDLIKATQTTPMSEMKISELDWIVGDMTEVDTHRIGLAKTVYPLIVTQQVIPGRWVVLDGFHRLCSLILQGRTLAKVRIITAKQLDDIHNKRSKPVLWG